MNSMNIDKTLLITYKNPHNKDALPADLCFTGKKEIILGIKLGVRLGLEMTFFSTSEDVHNFAENFLCHYME